MFRIEGNEKPKRKKEKVHTQNTATRAEEKKLRQISLFKCRRRASQERMNRFLGAISCARTSLANNENERTASLYSIFMIANFISIPTNWTCNVQFLACHRTTPRRRSLDPFTRYCGRNLLRFLVLFDGLPHSFVFAALVGGGDAGFFFGASYIISLHTWIIRQDDVVASCASTRYHYYLFSWCGIVFCGLCGWEWPGLCA